MKFFFQKKIFLMKFFILKLKVNFFTLFPLLISMGFNGLIKELNFDRSMSSKYIIS